MEQRKQWKWNVLLVLISSIFLTACGSAKPEKKDAFFTSGSREADQRASQRMSKEQQLSGDKATGEKGKTEEGEGKKVETRKTLFERLGGEQGLTGIIDDFTPRVLQDPRVNWARKKVDTGGLLGKGREYMWNATPQNVAVLKKHMVQFFALATGGPAKYEGKQMVNAHHGMKITNPEFDAVIGDMKATLDQLKVPDGEQKELLSIIESTRPQIVTER